MRPGVTGKGQHFANPKHLAQAERNLKRKQRKLSRKQKGSKSRDKARRLVARCHERVKKDFLHQISRRLVDENQALAVEDLNVKNGQGTDLGKGHLGRWVGDVHPFLSIQGGTSGKTLPAHRQVFPVVQAVPLL